MDRRTGKKIAGFAHLRQSIEDILSTPKGTRVMRRPYGSDLPRLVDSPINAEFVMRIYAATAEAFYKWEPRLTLKRVEADLTGVVEGRIGLTVTGLYVPTGREVRYDAIVLELRR